MKQNTMSNPKEDPGEAAKELARRYLAASASRPAVAERYARLLPAKLPPGQSANDWLENAAQELVAPPNQENS